MHNPTKSNREILLRNVLSMPFQLYLEPDAWHTPNILGVGHGKPWCSGQSPRIRSGQPGFKFWVLLKEYNFMFCYSLIDYAGWSRVMYCFNRNMNLWNDTLISLLTSNWLFINRKHELILTWHKVLVYITTKNYKGCINY